MSEDSEVPKLKPQEPESTGSENGGETKKTLKRNYCYVCEVQCTALKNFLDHQKGKKHIKKLKLKKAADKRKQKQDRIINATRNPIKQNLRSSNSVKPYEQNSKELHEAHDSYSGVLNSDDKGMNNSKKPKYKKNHYNNSNNQNNYSRRQNSRYYSNHYEGDHGYFYNERPKSSYTWRASHYSDPPMHNSFNNYQFADGDQYYSDAMYNQPFQKEYFPGKRNANFMPNDYLDQEPCLPFSTAEPDNSVYNFLSNEMSETQQLESNSIPSETANKLSSKGHISETSNSEQGSAIDSNQSSASKTGANKVVNSSLRSHVLSSTISKSGEKKRLRTRSLSSAESVNSDKKLKDKNEHLSADSEGTPEEQKLKEYTTSLLETNPNRISLMIQHPSSHKEKAVLNHIMTSFSKTRRKENLTRKLRSNSLGSAENNDDASLDIQSASSENDEVSIIMPSEIAHVETSTKSVQNKCLPAVKKNGNSSEECNLYPMLNNKDSNNANSPQVLLGNQSSKKSSKVNGKSKENSFSISRIKIPEKRKEKSSEAVCSKKVVKRKSYNDTNKNKKQKSCEGGNLDISSTSKQIEQKDPNKDMTPVVNSLNQSSSVQITPVTHIEIAPVKEEVTDCTDMNQTACEIEPPKDAEAEHQIIDYNSQFSVETLIELFASGNVTVKKEFNDPVIDAIKGVDPNELINACSNDSHLNNSAEATHMTAESSVIRPKSPISVPNFSAQEHTNCINPVILGSIDNDNITVSMAQRPPLVPSPAPTEISKNMNSSSMSDASEKSSLSEVEKLSLITRTKLEFPHLITLIEKLQEIASAEEKVKDNLIEAKCKINVYSNILEEWKNKKKKLQDEEEELRKKRNDIIQLMQNAIKIPHDNKSEIAETEFLLEVHSTPDKSKGQQNAIQTNKSTEVAGSSPSSSLLEDHLPKPKSNSTDSDEILILPSPVKPMPPEITIIDDTEENSTKTQRNKKSLGAGDIAPNFPNQGSSLLDTKNLTAHSTVVNCIVVFDDFVYTCSNDNNAKRFSLKDTSQTVTYSHAAKNVTEISVEKVQNEALVFTSCSNRVLSLFIASNGAKIKTFFQSSNIKSICKGWGKFYAGMEDGTVNVYNWKHEEKEFVKTQNSACRIATVHQGGLHILIILTSDGHVSLRDAKTSLLIRFIKTSIKFPAWLTVHNDFVFLSSSDRTVSVLDIQSGRVERKLQLSQSHATGLAVYDDHIFTISYSGLICCVNKDRLSEVTLYYGAGKTGLTCIHVYQNWVFTGNRKGDISVVRFDPYARFSCKIGKCKFIYGSKEDLAFHFELQHLKKNLALCQWEKCPFIFPVNYTNNDKVNHLKKHILPVPRGSAV